MSKAEYKFKAKVWLYPGMSGWHFISLPEEESAEIKGRFGLMRPGFGAVPVAITIGGTRWRTSIFPDKKSGRYVLPVKSEVRKKECRDG
jgi:Domain of unknown function (DUF1905)